MTTELHVNGRVCVDLSPEHCLESAVLTEMVNAAEKGKAVRIERLPGEQLRVRVSVEK